MRAAEFLVFALLATFPCAAMQAPESCASLAKLTLPATTITTAETIAGGAFTPPGGKAIEHLPAFCRVSGVIRPSTDSNIEFEVWMPASGWNHRFQDVGNGGFAGAINYANGGLATAISRGYAAASTDTGHKGGSADAAWALGHPEKIVDFGYRAMHETTVQAKAIVKAFYGEAPRHSYFASCSNGGRQALMEAQRYPADYDGIIAGAPANAWTSIFAGFLWNAQALSVPGAYIPPSKAPAIERAVVTACDARDGVKDGVLDDPSKCAFDPTSMLCKQDDSADCLTAPQVEALKKIYSGPRDPSGKLLVPGFEPGGEGGEGGWGLWILGRAPGQSLQATFGIQFASNMVFNNARWDYKTFDFGRDMKIVNDRMGHILNATDPNLKAFQSRGGKLILWHGWSDPALPPQNTVNYFKAVKARMGAKAVDSFVRLYMLPGTQHCIGGPGPDYCGGLMAAQGDADHDLSAALERWVEQGVAPGRMTAVKFARQLDFKSGVVRSRPLCPYPQTAVYQGSGSTDEASNFECRSQP